MSNFVSAGIIAGAVVLSLTNTFQALYTTNKYMTEHELIRDVRLADGERFTITFKDGKCLTSQEVTNER